MRPKGSSGELEARRQRAVRLLRRGGVFRAVAQQVGASLSSVVRWWQAYRRKGKRGLRSKPVPGRPPQLRRQEKKTLEKLLLRGPLAAGYSTDVWTLRRIVDVIRKHFDVHYHPGHVWKLLRDDLGWSCQKPERRASERNEEAIAHWKRYKWPHIKKDARTWRPSGLSG